jgi:hypothetical protein
MKTLAPGLLLWALLSSALQTSPAPVIDGRIGDAEWAGAMTERLEGGGTLRLLQRGEFLYIAVEGLGPGLASVCAARGATVRILHASAAVGEARYERGAAGWTKMKGFAWRLRDSPRSGPPAVAQNDEFLRDAGWLANPNASGSPQREFQIRAADVDAIGVTFLTTTEPMKIARWPATIKDDCGNLRVAQGFLPESTTFDPASWYRVSSR